MLKKIISAQGFMLSRMWKCSRLLFFTSFLLAVLNGITPSITVYLSKLFVENLTSLNWNNSIISILLIVGTQLALFVATLLIDKVNGDSYARIKQELWFELFEKSCTIDLALYELPENKTLYQEARGATQNNRCNKILDSFFSIVSTTITIVSLIAIMASVELYVILIVIATATLRVIGTVVRKKREYRVWKEDAKLNKEVEYCMGLLFDHGYASEMRINNIYSWVIEKYKKARKKSDAIWAKNRSKEVAHSIFDAIIKHSEEILLYLYLAWQMIFHQMSYANFTMFFTAIRTFSSSLSGAVDLLIDIGENAFYIESFKKYIEIRNVIAIDRKEDSRIHGISTQSMIAFNHVSFQYPNSDYVVLKDVNISLEANRFYVIVGANGAGKTTFINLLCRLYDPISGSIKLDDTDIKEYRYSDYRNLFSCVFQDYKIYDYSVAENIAGSLYNDDPIILDKIRLSLIKTGLYEKIETLPNGLNTCLGKSFDENGVYLSGGEVQRIALAKALFRDSPILILDEP